MNDDFDIEGALRRYSCKPGENTRRSVLARFIQARQGGAPDRNPDGFWHKPVPLYLVASVILVFACLSFIAGQKTTQGDMQTTVSEEPSQERPVVTSEDIKWVVAENDLL